MKGAFAALYSALAYVFFLGVFLCAIAFVEGVVIPKTIDSGEPGDMLMSLLINAGLLSVFAVQHSVMARPAFKRWWTRLVPKAVERSTYVVFSSAALALVLWKWQPVPQLVWSVGDPMLAMVITVMSWSGFGLVLASTFLISHFHLFGLSQGFARMLKIKEGDGPFVTPLFYRFIRHPLYLGFIIAFWAAPQMSVGHLFFAVMTTGYILVGIWFEERDLVAHFGQRYLTYRRRVGMLVPKLRGTRDGEEIV